MTAALIILAALVVVGLVLYLLHKRDERRDGVGQTPVTPPVADMPAGVMMMRAPAVECISHVSATPCWLRSARL